MKHLVLVHRHFSKPLHCPAPCLSSLMAAGLSSAPALNLTCVPRYSFHDSSALSLLPRNFSSYSYRSKRKPMWTTLCFVLQEKRLVSPIAGETHREEFKERNESIERAEDRLARKRSERFTYLVAAVMSSLGITSMAAMAVYYRFYWQMEGGEVPLVEMFGTFSLSVGAAVGMEFWARWAHRSLWHASLWHMHESHHRPRDGPFELNDVFAIINAVPAMALLSYGFFHKGLVPGLCFGAGLGITMFGIAYMFVHDGLVHKRFPVGPIANVPYLRKVAAAHQLHHSDKFDGVPYGLFLGPKELEKVGGVEELEKEIKRRIKSFNSNSSSP